MCALSSPVVRPSAGGVPRRAAAAPSDASERASGNKCPRVITKMTHNRNSVVAAAGMEVITVGGAMSSQKLLQKRLASELDALHGILKKAEVNFRGRGACKGGAPTAGKKERVLACKSNQRAKPVEDGAGNAPPSVKRRKISTSLVEQKQKQIRAPRMSQEERKQPSGRLSSLSGELKTRLDKFAEESKNDKVTEESKNDKLAEKSKNDKLAEKSKDKKPAEESKDEKPAEESKDDKQKEEVYADISGGLSFTIETGSKPSSSSSADSSSSDARVVQQSSKAKVQDAQRAAINRAVDMRGLLYKANLRRQQLEMERADQRFYFF